MDESEVAKCKVIQNHFLKSFVWKKDLSPNHSSQKQTFTPTCQPLAWKLTVILKLQLPFILPISCGETRYCPRVAMGRVWTG
jgi:hypothetical protein